jgi:ribosomal protein S21
MVEFKRKKGESFESFLRRFNKALIQSRKLNEVRQRQYQKKDKNKNQQKKYALVSRQLREKKEYLKKTGKLKEESKNRW